MLSRGGQMVAPGAMTPYSGGGGRRRHGGYVSVRKPADGFFVAGSTIKAMNGLYGKSEWVPRSVGDKHECQLAYRHDQSGWLMVLCDAPPKPPTHFSYGAEDETEWLFVDPSSEDRFSHEGDTIIPGSGKSWKHVHRRPAAATAAVPPVPPASATAEGGVTVDSVDDDSDSDASVDWHQDAEASVQDAPAAGATSQTAEDAGIAVAVIDDIDELPWQVIAILSTDMLRKLRGHYRWHEHNIREARDGVNLPAIADYGSFEEGPPADFVTPPLVASDATAFAMLASDESRAACVAALDGLTGWSAAVLLRHKASCHRRARDFDDCAAALDAALDAFPRYAAALFEKALMKMDQCLYTDAVKFFETVMHLNREYDSIGVWLVRALAAQRRKTEGDKKAELAGNLDWDGIIPGVAPIPVAAAPAAGGDTSLGLDDSDDEDNGIDDGSLAGGGFDAPVPAGGDTSLGLDDSDDEIDDGSLGLMGIDDVPGAASSGSSASAPATPSAVDAAADARWRSTDHYAVLGVPCDLPVAPEGHDIGDAEAHILKRAYKKLSRAFHPDKRGGSVEAFQRIILAYETLSDPKKRRGYDCGDALEREEQRDGGMGPSHKVETERKYFPENFDFAPFGDPLEDRREREERERKRVEQQKAREARRQANIKARQEGRSGGEFGGGGGGYDARW